MAPISCADSTHALPCPILLIPDRQTVVSASVTDCDNLAILGDSVIPAAVLQNVTVACARFCDITIPLCAVAV